MSGRDKTPWELFSGKKKKKKKKRPDVSGMRIFGAEAYALILKQLRRKLDNHSEPGRLVGYRPNSKGYKVLLSSGKLVIFDDVVFVEDGFRQKEGVDFDEVFAPVSKYSTLRALMAVAAVEDLEVHQLDIKTAFLNGVLQEEVYIEQPAGYHEGGPDIGCHLQKALYGLRQASRAWHTRLTEELVSLGLQPSAADPGLHYLNTESGRIYLLVYVDDILIAARSKADVEWVKKALADKFEAHDLGEAHYFLGIDIVRNRAARTVKLSQKRLTAELVDNHGMGDCKARLCH